MAGLGMHVELGEAQFLIVVARVLVVLKGAQAPAPTSTYCEQSHVPGAACRG